MKYQIMKSFLKNLIPLVTLSLLLNASALAGGREEVLQIQKNLEDRLTPIAKAYDPRAMIIVKVELKTQKRALPGTPFVMSNLSLQDAGGDLEVRQTEITILSQKTPFSPKVVDVMKGVASQLGFKADFKVQELPPEFAPVADKSDQKREDGKSDASEHALKNLNTTVNYAIFGVVGALLTLGALVYFSRRSGSKELVSALEGGFQKINGAMESGFGGAAPARAPEAAQQSQAFSPQASGSEGSSIKEYNEESLLACLGDCYWSEADAYAAFVWKRISAEKRKNLLSKATWMADYAMAVSGMNEQDLGAIEEPYYLAPLPLGHLSNQALVEAVRKTPDLFSNLSSLRAKALPLSARERIALVQASAQAGSKLSAVASARDFEQLAASQPRALKKRNPIPIRDVAEEAEILALPGVTIDLMSEVASLGWLKHLPQAEVDSILSGYTAREIASCWIGPVEVLQSLEKSLSPKKREMVLSYTESTQASRDSETFRSIHGAAITWLRKNPDAVQAPAATQRQSHVKAA
jgi:hypothetical protein